MTLGTIRPHSLVDQTVQRLREAIADGHWQVGARLPGENALAKELGVGRSTVREAVRSLTVAGLVQPRQGAGVFVVATTPREDWLTMLRHASVTDVYEVRAMVEVEAAYLAAARRTAQDLEAMDAALERRRRAAAEGNAEFVDADVTLHAAVVAAAHNPVLTGLFEEFLPSLRSGLVDLLELTGLRSGAPDHGEDAHAALVEAVRAGEAETAGRILRDEFRATLAQLTRLV